MELGSVNSSTGFSPADGALFTDLGALAKLRSQADQDSDGTLKAVAQQFESLFVQMMMKSMRDASEKSGLYDENPFNSDQMKFHQSMFDQQMSLHLSQSGGIGLAPIIERQLSNKPATASDDAIAINQDWLQKVRREAVLKTQPAAPMVDMTAAAKPVVDLQSQADFAPTSQEQFIRELWPHAEKAARALGVDTEVLVAQAALESGWGQRMIRDANGSNSFNLFGIKAHGGWQGDRAQVNTVEYRDGVAQREQAQFRSYGSLAESFTDYVDFLQQQPRYQQALAAVSEPQQFLRELQNAGYATDPQYANKIGAVMQGDSFRAQVAALKSSLYAQAN